MAGLFSGFIQTMKACWKIITYQQIYGLTVLQLKGIVNSKNDSYIVHKISIKIQNQRQRTHSHSPSNQMTVKKFIETNNVNSKENIIIIGATGLT